MNGSADAAWRTSGEAERRRATRARQKHPEFSDLADPVTPEILRWVQAR